MREAVREAPELEPVAEPNSRRAVGGPAAVLALQRQAGNRNVVRALARKKAPPVVMPEFKFRPSVNGKACACIVFMHNNERNARLTAELLHKHCGYNLVIVEPDSGSRRVKLPQHKATEDFDPNEFFPREIIEECLADPQPCRDFIAKNKGATDAKTVEQLVQHQFFLALWEGSEGFKLPVVALHNNAVDDTARYRAAKPKSGKKTIAGGTFGTGKDDKPRTDVTKWITDEYGADTTKQLTGRKGTTNIFRWCMSDDIARCHIGDPDHPDSVAWTTNEADFNKLATQPLNVVLQSGAATTGESATDLSTVFLSAGEVINAKVDEFLGQLPADWTGVRKWVDQLRRDRLAKLRYINVETPQTPTHGESAADLRDESFSTILAALRAAGLDCCGTKGETAIRAGLKAGKLD